jgi:hypothetical protein
MKKVFIAVSMLALVIGVKAQERVTTTYTTTTTNYGYSVPTPIITTFELEHPNVTNVTWTPMNDWWYATYPDDMMISRVYYNTQPYYLEREEGYRVSLPVLNTYVPENVIRDAISKHGNNIFSITTGKMTESGHKYYVTVIRDGKSEIIPLDSSGM